MRRSLENLHRSAGFARHQCSAQCSIAAPNDQDINQFLLSLESSGATGVSCLLSLVSWIRLFLDPGRCRAWIGSMDRIKSSISLPETYLFVNCNEFIN